MEVEQFSIGDDGVTAISDGLKIVPYTKSSAGDRLVFLNDLCLSSGAIAKSSHKIRKTYISSLFDKGININTIREQAGHEDERTSLNNYCFDQNTNSVMEEKLESATNKIVCI